METIVIWRIVSIRKRDIPWPMLVADNMFVKMPHWHLCYYGCSNTYKRRVQWMNKGGIFHQFSTPFSFPFFLLFPLLLFPIISSLLQHKCTKDSWILIISPKGEESQLFGLPSHSGHKLHFSLMYLNTASEWQLRTGKQNLIPFFLQISQEATCVGSIYTQLFYWIRCSLKAQS